jgi:glycerol kinase
VAEHWRCEKAFAPQMAEEERNERYGRWQGAVKRVLGA